MNLLRLPCPSVVTVLVATVTHAAQAPTSPRTDFDVLIQAGDFLAGSIRAVPRGGWADAEPIIQCADRSPDWAEWSFTVEEEGVYRIFAKFAAAASRPVQVSIDGNVVAPAGLSETTGSWLSSTARWGPVGVAALQPGRHTLKVWRASCIPHIVSFGLLRDSTIDMSRGPLALPQEMWVDDGYAVQDWMIWTIGGIEQFAVSAGAYHINNGRHLFNRPLYGTPGPETAFGGDGPAVLFCRGPQTKLGVLRLELVNGEKRKWLHDAEDIQFTWNGAWVTWEVRDGLLGAGIVTIGVVPLIDAPGYLARIQGPPGAQLDAWLGGIRDHYPDNRAGYGAMPVGDLDADTAANQVRVDGHAVHLANPDTPGGECAAWATADANWRGVETAGGKGRAARLSFTVSGAPVYLTVATDSDAWIVARQDARKAWSAACRHYEQRADRLHVDTPAPILDAAIRSNNTVMDGQCRPPSYLHGALRWGTECGGWYLGWRGWYGPIVAGDWEQVRAAAEMHLRHQFQKPDHGLVSRGKIANFVSFDGAGSDTHTGYNMQEVFLDHLRSYLNWTGDTEFLVKQWPKIRLALEYERREISRGLDGLYTNAVNTWISDGHHYNGCACTQASAYAVARNRFAAEVARLAGDSPDEYENQAAITLREMNRRLWLPEKGYFAEYVDEDGLLHEAAEAPTVYHPIEMGAADPFQAYQMTRYVDERLWRFGDQILANDWFPVIVTNGLLGFNETLNTALAYFYAGRFERGWRLLKTCCESTAKAATPGSLSCYASKKGEQGTYIDFTDATSLLARTTVEGLFGLRPRVDLKQATWAPGFPRDWDHAALRTRGFRLQFRRRDNLCEYALDSQRELKHRFRIPLDCAHLSGLTVNGKPARGQVEAGVGRPWLVLDTEPTKRTVVRFAATGDLPAVRAPATVARGDSLRIQAPGGTTISDLRDPQSILDNAVIDGRLARATISRDDGPHTVFVRLRGGPGEWWAPVNVECTPLLELRDARIAAVIGLPGGGLHLRVRNHRDQPLRGPAIVTADGQRWSTSLALAPGEEATLDLPFSPAAQLAPGHTPVRVKTEGVTLHGVARLWRLFAAFPDQRDSFTEGCRLLDFTRNGAVDTVFIRHYPRGQGPQLNNWTWYETDYINADALRQHAKDGVLVTQIGVPFAVNTEGDDALFLSRWEPFPTHANIPVGAPVRADRLYLLLCNHTHNSQTHMTQASVELVYADGARQTVPLRGPRDLDGMLQHYSDMAPEWIGGREQGWYGHGRATGVHADVTDIPVDPQRELVAFELRCLTRETLIGLLGATVHQVP